MVLSDGEILEALEIGDLELIPRPGTTLLLEKLLQPSSIDLQLDTLARVHRKAGPSGITVDPTTLENVRKFLEDHTEPVTLSTSQPYHLAPGEFLLCQTKEKVSLSRNLAGRVEGKSSLARFGITVHFTAPKIDPGFHNNITLEIYNLGPFTVYLRPDMQICTLILERLGKPAMKVYEGRFNPPP